MTENLENLSQEQVQEQPKVNNQVVPTNEQSNTSYDYSILFRQGMSHDNIAGFAEIEKADVVMPDFETFKQKHTDLSEQDQITVFNEAYKGYQLYQEGGHDKNRSLIFNLGKLPYTTVYENLGWETQPRPDAPSIPMSNEYAFGPGFFHNPGRVSHPDWIAENVGYYLNSDNHWEENTWRNRLGNFFSRQENLDPNSPFEYYWKEVGLADGLINPETIRTILGPRNLDSTTLGSLVNLRGFTSQSLGLTSQALGAILRTSSVLMSGLYNWGFSHANNNMQDHFTFKIANTMTNFGAYLSHQNMDEMESMFSSGSSFSYHFYGGIGQLFSMAYAAKLARGMTLSPQKSAKMSLMLGASQAGANFQTAILRNGGTEAEAASAFVLFGAVTYMANMLLGANLAQRLGLKKVSDLAATNANRIAGGAKTASSKPIAAMSQQTKDSVNSAMVGSTYSKIKNLRLNASNYLERFSDKVVDVGGFKIPIGYMVGMGAEEFAEEVVEELVHTPMEGIYNKHLALPRAREIVRGTGQNRYDSYTDENGVIHYYKMTPDGRRVNISYELWNAEQQDLRTAQGVLNGEYPFDAKFSWDEPFAALLSSMAGGLPLYYIGGGHKVRQANDQNYYRQNIALAVAKHKPAKRKVLLRDIKLELERTQKESNAFGSNYLTEDGSVVSEGDKGRGVVSVADKAIETFMNDLMLDIEAYDRFHKDNPTLLQSHRQNRYLYHEAFEVVKAINEVEHALAAMAENQPVVYSGQVKEGDTKEVLEKRLEGLRQQYKDVVMPVPGGDGHSKRYSEIHFDTAVLENLIEKQAKANIIAQFKQDKKEVDPASDEFKNALRKETKRIRLDDQELWLLGWLRTPEKMRQHLSPHNQISVYGFLDHVYRNLIGKEMDVVASERNEQIKKAQQDYKNLDQLLENFQKSVSEFTILDTSKYGGEVTAEAWSEFNKNTETIRSIMGQAQTLAGISRYNSLMDEQSQALTNAFNSLAQKMTGLSEFVGKTLEYDENVHAKQDMTGITRPGQDLISYFGGIEPLIQEALSLSQNLPSFERSSQIENLANENPELATEFRQEALRRFMEGVFKSGLPEGQAPSTRTITSFLKGELEKLKDDNFTVDAETAEFILGELETIENLVNMLGEAVEMNVDFIQNLNKEDARHSMLKIPNDRHLFFTKEELTDLQALLEERNNDIFEIRNSEKMKSFSRDLEQTRDYVRDLSLRNYFLNDVHTYLLSTDDISPEFAQAFDAVGHAFGKDKGPEVFNELFNEYQDKSDKALETKERVRGKLLEIEKLIIKAEESLSGKLGKYISMIRSKSAELKTYNEIDELQTSNVLVRSGSNITGGLTVDGLLNFKSEKERNSNQKFFMLTNAMMIHRFGQKRSPAERGFSISEFLQAYREVAASRNIEQKQADDSTNQDIDLIAEPWHATTYAQERLVLQMVSFGMNPGMSSMLHMPDDYLGIMQKAMYVRGFAGTGKTTQVLMDVYAVMEELTGKKQFITVVVPTAHLKDTHIANFEKLGKIAGKDYKILYKHEFIQDQTKNLEGIVIVDESSIWGPEVIDAVRTRFDNVVSFWVGDDAQTPAISSPVAIIDSPIKRYAAERTVPITEVFRTGNRQIESIQDYYRKVFNREYTPNAPTLTYSIDPTTGIVKGGVYYADSDDMRENFIKQYELTPVEKRHFGEIIYIVPSTKNRNELLHWIETKHGADKRTELEPFIFTVEYDIMFPHTCVSGLSSERVFFEYEAQKFVNDQYRDTIGGNIDLEGGNNGALYYVQAGRVGLTGASRAKSFLGLIGNPERSSLGTVFESQSVKSNQQYKNETDAQVERLEYLVGEKTTYKDNVEDEPDGGTPVVDDFDRNITVTPQNRKEIIKSPEFRSFRDTITKLNPERGNQILEEGGVVIHANELAMEVDGVKKSEKDPQYKDQREANRIKNNYFIQAIRFVVTGDTRYQQAAMDGINRLNAHYRKMYAKQPDSLESALIRKPENYFAKTILELQLPFGSLKQDELSVLSPTFLNEDITVKNKKGEIETISLQGTPAIVKVVGFANIDGNKVPIIDIEDFVIHSSTESFTGDSGPYTKAKMAAYVLMARKSGMRVNNITLNHYFPTNATITLLGHEILDDQEIIEATQELMKVAYLNKELPSESTTYLASEQELYQNEAIVEHSYYKHGHYFVNEKNGEIVKVDHVGAKTDGSGIRKHNVYFTKGKKGVKLNKLTADSFAGKYIPIRESEEFYDGLRFKKRAQAFKNGTTHFPDIKNAIQGHTLIIPTVVNAEGLTPDKIFSHQAMKARNTLIGKLASRANLVLEKAYMPTFRNTAYDTKTKKFGYQDFSDVLVNRLTDSFLDSDPTLVKNTLVEAGIVEAKTKLSKEKLKELFKENNFHLLSMDNVPEFSFRNKDNNSISLVPSMKQYLNEAPNTEGERNAFKQLATKIEEGFKKEEDPGLRELLINYNLAKAVQLKQAKLRGTLETRIADVEIGNIVKGKDARPVSELISLLEGRGFVVGEAQPTAMKKESGKVYFALPISRPGYAGSINIEMDAIAATTEDIQGYVDELADTWQNNKELLALVDDIQELVSHTEADRHLSKEELKQLKNSSHAARNIIEASSAYQFLRANQAVLRAIHTELELEARQVELELDGKAISATGNLFYFHPRWGLEIVGNTVYQKYLNVFAVINAVKSYVQKTGRVKDQKVVFRQNPFYVKFDEGGVELAVGKDALNTDLLETTVEEVKTPELYTTTDLSGRYLNMAKSMIYDISEESTATPKQEGPAEGKIGDDIADIDIDDDGLFKVRNYEIGGESAMPVSEAVQQVNNLIGEIADKALKIRKFEIRNRNDAALFGRMIKGVIELSGYQYNGEWVVEKFTPRHETIHFIMNYMLDSETHQKVLDDLKKELGKAFVEGDIRQLYEHAADMFQTMSDVAKPKGIFQKFVYGIKWLGTKLGMYHWDLHEMLYAADSGYYRNGHVYSSPNYAFDSLENRRSKDGYDNPKNLLEVINKFGHINIYAYVRDFVVGERLKSYLPIGRSLLKTAGTLDEGIYRTVKYYGNKRVFKGSDGLTLGEHFAIVGGKVMTVQEMTADDFLLARRERTPEAKKLMEDYIHYQLSFDNNILHIIKEIFPDMNLDEAYFLGKDIYEKNLEKKKTSNASAAKNIHSEAEKQSMRERMPNMLKFALNTVPYYQIVNNDVDPNSTKRFVPGSHVEKIFTDSLYRIKYLSTDFMKAKFQEAINQGFDTLLVTPELLFEEMAYYAQNEITDAYTRNVYESILYEFGNKEVRKELKDGETGSPYHSREGNRVLVGLWNIIKNPTEYAGEESQNQTDFTERVKPMRDLLSGIISYFGSLEIRRIGIVNFENGNFDVRNNQAVGIEKVRLKEAMDATLVDESGKVNEEIANRLNPNSDTHYITVTLDGFDVMDESGQSMEAIRSQNHLKRTQGKNFGMLLRHVTMMKTANKAFTKVYSKESKKKNLNPQIIKKVLNTIGIYRYNDYLLTQAFENKNKDGKNSIFNILHKLLMATKVNAELYDAIIKEIEQATIYISKDPDAPAYSIREKALESLDPEVRAMYDFIMKQDYGIVNNEIVNKADNTPEVTFFFEQWNETIILPSPLDYFTLIEKISSMISDASMDQILNTKTAEGETTHTQVPGSLISELDRGSDVYVEKKKAALRPALLEGTDHPLISEGVSQKGNKVFRYNSPFLNGKMGFDNAVDFGGIKNEFRGLNFRNNSDADLQIAIIESFFGMEMNRQRSWNRINVLLSVFADKSKATVLPIFFFKKGRGKKEVDSLMFVKRKGGKIQSISVNESLLADNFSDIVSYYDKRYQKSQKKFMNTMGMTQKDFNNYIKSGNLDLEVTPEQEAKIRFDLEEFRDYSIVRKDGKTFVRPGNAVFTNNQLFNQGFIEAWKKTDNDTERYNLLKAAVKEDFLDWIASLKKSGALDALISSNRNIPSVFFSTFQDVEVNDLITDRADYEILGNIGKHVSPEAIGSYVGEQLRTIREKWLKDNLYDKNGNKLTPEQAEVGFEPLTIDGLNKMINEVTKELILEDMYSDDGLRTSIHKVRTEASTITTKYTKKSIAQMTDTQWSPALEALYMSYLLANEAISHLDRQDSTLFKNPAQYIKRGSGIVAPGNNFDLSNEFGVGRNTQVAIMNDIPGFNRFLGWEPNDARGYKLMTDGSSPVNPVWLKLLQRSAGGDFGVIGDYANKTVLYGYDIANDKSFYFKFSQNPVDGVHFRNSSYHQAMMKAMLGEYYDTFLELLNRYNDFDLAVERMADFVVDSDNMDADGLLPRDKMIGYVAHASTFKQGLSNINDYEYDGTEVRSSFNVRVPENLSSISVPNSFLRLQVVNNGDGHASLHSFATQLFSVLGVGDQNHQYMNEFNDALKIKVDQFTNTVNLILNSPVSIDGTEATREMTEKERNTAALNYVKKVIRDNAGRSIKGSKLEALLRSAETKGEVFGNKMFEALSSHLNDFLKPDVPGSNYVQQTGLMKIFQGEQNGSIYLASDIGLENDAADAGGFMRRNLRPMTYFSKSTDQAFVTKEELEKALKDNPNDIGVTPTEVMMKFQYARKFGIDSNESLQGVFGLKNGISLYETGLERSKGLGTLNGREMAERIFTAIGKENATFQDLMNEFTSPESQKRIYDLIYNRAINELLGKEKRKYTKDEINVKVTEFFTEQLMNEDQMSWLLQEVGDYYFNLNNALDVILVRIPTTNASAASTGRIVAFTDTGNSIYTSAEKSILDGSDYDHDELHVFYRSFENNGIPAKGITAENRMFSAIQGFYSNPSNYNLVLEPIDLGNMEDFAERNLESSGSVAPKIANSISHNIFMSGVNFAGVNLVGHFANQMNFTNRLISQTQAELEATVNPEMAAVFNSEAYPQILSFISNLVNAATDNAALNGLLGRLNISNAVTPLIAGMVLHVLPQEIVTKRTGEDGEVFTDTQIKNIENQVLEMLQDRLVRSAAREVIRSSSLRGRSRTKKIWEAIAEKAENWKTTGRNMSRFQKADKLLAYAYAGEQLLRLGNLYKIIQELPGDKSKANQMIFNIEKALGQTIDGFLQDNVLENAREVSYQSKREALDDAVAQLGRLSDMGHTFKEGSAFAYKHELDIRSSINIRRIAANNPLILSQLRALSAFNQLYSMVNFSAKRSDIRKEIMQKIGVPELLFSESYNDYENSIKKLLIGTFMQLHGPSDLVLNYWNPLDHTDEVTRAFDLKNPSDQMEFIIHFSEYIQALRKRFPESDFLKRIDFEKSGRNPILVANFRNSIYIDPAEKAAYAQDFKRIKKDAPEAARALQYYQLLVYGFSFRNGSFSEVIDSEIEIEFSKNQDNVEEIITERFANDRELLLREIAFNAEEIIPFVSDPKNASGDYYRTSTNTTGLVSMWEKVRQHDTTGLHVNDANAALVNQIFPKELYVGVPGLFVTNDFVYRDLSKKQLMDIRNEGQTTKVTPSYINVSEQVHEPGRMRNRPYSGSNVRTILNDIATVQFQNSNSATFTRLRDKDRPSQSRITLQGSSVSEHAIGNMLTVFQRAFPGISFEFVSDQTSLTDGIAYYHRGVVYINRNKVQVDTFLHELTHPLLHVLKEVRPAQYQALYDDAIRMINEEDPIIDLIKKHYPNVHGSDFVDEVIANITGWVSADVLTNRLAIMNDPNYKQNGQTFWERFKTRINNFWSSIKSFFKGYDISIDPKTATIRDFAKDVVTKALAGRNVMNISPVQLQNLSRAGYENVWEQRSEPIKSNRELFNLLMNTGTIKQGEELINIPQYRDLNKDERIQRFVDSIPQKNYVHLTRSGELIEFDKNRPETWKTIVEEKILTETDENSIQIKKRILDSISGKDFTPQKLQAAFGVRDNNKPNVSEQAIDKLLRQIRYHPRHKYMLYSDLIGTDYEFMYDESLVGFNPVVSIEYDKDDQMIVSLYHITNESVKHRDKLAPYEKRNILNRYYFDGHAQRKGIEMQANMGDVSNLLLGVIAGKIQGSSKKVYVNQVGTISFNAKDSHMNLMFAIDLKSNIEAMLESEEFKSDLSPELIAHLEKFTNLTDGFDYESVLFNWYGEFGHYKQEVEAFKNGSLNAVDKKTVFLRRLAYLSKKTLGEISSSEAMEIDMLFKAIALMNSGKLIENQMNSKSDIKKFEALFSPQFDVGHQMVDVIRRATLETSQKNVRKMQEFKRKINEFAEFFRDRYVRKHGALEERVRDVTWKYYDEILAKVTDRDGIKRFAGSVLWTTDKKLDPMFYQQAQQLSPELLKWGKFLVDIVTDTLAENIYHSRIMEYGPMIKKNNVPVPYTKEMAKDDLFKNTSYKQGMLPLMPDTVGQMLSKGKFNRARKTKMNQIESSYIQFEEIASMTDKEANNLDRMPDMFMEQFANRIMEEDVGSLGLSQNRMFKLLGLAEYKGEYIYDSVSNRGENLNTDLETMIEFFKMSSLRKIGYEQNVLPLLNGAMLYMNDLQSNLEFKQENALKYLDMFRTQAIEGKRKKLDLNIGVNVEPIVLTAMSFASPLVMAGNVNVMAVSGIHNFMMAFIEGVGNNIYNALTPEQKRHWFTSGDLVKASGLFFYDFHKISELMREFQLINPNEYEMITHRFNQKRKKHVFSDFYAQWMNWAADFYARGVVMAAQMLRDGSYYAYNYDSESGRMIYNPTQDRKYFNEDNSQSPDQKVLYDALKDRLVDQGIGLKENGDALLGYSFEEMRTFKGLADKYIVGAYGPLEKNLLSQFLLGRMVMMFTTWFMTKISMALKSGSYLDEVGYYEITKDSQGNLVPQWQREWTEGYMRTITRMSTDLILKGNISQFKQIKPAEKYNWIKGTLTLATFLLTYGIYALGMSEKEDPEEREASFLGVHYKRFEKTRLRQNWAYAAGSLMVLPTIFEKLVSPFAVIGILGRAFTQGLKITEGKWENLKYVLPYFGGFFTLRDEYRALFNRED